MRFICHVALNGDEGRDDSLPTGCYVGNVFELRDMNIIDTHCLY